MSLRIICPLPPDAMEVHGPTIDARVRPDACDAATSAHFGAASASVPVRFMVDTGTSHCVLALSAVRDLGLASYDTTELRGVGGEYVVYHLYMATMLLPVDASGDEPAIIVAPFSFIGVEFHRHDRHRGLIGRDFLRMFSLQYEGPVGGFVLTTDAPFPTERGVG